MRNLTDFLLFIVLAIWVAACQQSTLIGEDLIDEDNTQVQEIDTLRVETSSLLLDSIYTTNASRLLAGAFADPYLGNVSAQCFFNLDSVDVFSIEDDDNLLFDSLSLSLQHDYEYPAPDHVQNLAVYTLKQKLDDEVFYFNHSAGPETLQKVGLVTFNTRTTRNKRFNIRLSNDLGRALFEVAKKQDELDIDNVIQGMSIRQEGELAGQSVMGFPTDSIYLQVHYHDRKTDEKGSVSLKLKPALRYNRLLGDRGQTALRNLTQRGTAIASRQTNAESYIQAGVGICTKLDFPTLRSIRQNRKISVNLAYLDIQPIKSSYQGSDLAPLENLYVYSPTHKNTLKQTFWSGSEINPVNIQRTVNTLTGNSTYRIYLTDYISNILNQDADEYDGILLYTSASSTGINELGRVVLGSGQHPREAAKLHVIFTVIK